ncbi:MAG TPA: O-antigen ligase family protein [Naasia sp.]
MLLLGAFILWALLSVLWSDYRLATLLAVVVLLVTTFAAITIVRARGWAGTVRTLSWALLTVVGLSLLFELMVEAIGRPVLPVFPINVEPGEKVPDAFYWSRALLFEGGRIQGILGNANLLGFVALLLLIVAGCQWAAGTVPRGYGAVAVALAVATLALTRSSTVIAATIAVVVLLVVVLLGRRSRWAGWAVAAGVVIVGSVGAVLFSPQLLGLLGKSDDLTGRLDIWASVTDLFLERSVIGWGWTSYWQPWVPLFQELAERNGVVYLQAHNAFLDVAFQLGVIGLALFVGFIVATCMAIGRRGIPLQGEGLRDAGWVVGKLLPSLLLAALLTQAVAESRLLVEGNWALLCIIAFAASGVGRGTTSNAPALPEHGTAGPELRQPRPSSSPGRSARRPR